MRAIVERGIGCDRAVLLDGDRLVEAHLERAGPRVGDRWAARVARIEGARGWLTLDGADAFADPLAAGMVEGACVAVEVVREALDEPGRRRAVRVRIVGAADGASAGTRLVAGPDLAQRLSAQGFRVEDAPRHGGDALEAAGWSEALDQARSGVFAFPGGTLAIARTAAFTVIDVDGAIAPAALALAAAAAVAHVVRLFGLGGAIVIDFPTLGDRAARHAVDAALDSALPRPFERTAINGFGLVQIVRPKLRPSLVDHMQGDPAHAAALALVRDAARTPGAGTTVLTAHPQVARVIVAHPDWLAEVARRSGRPARVESDAERAIWAGHVHAPVQA